MNSRVESNGTKNQARSAPAIVAAELDIKGLLLDIFSQKWFVVCIMFFSFLVILCYVLPIPPLYKTMALIQVENKETGLEALQGLDLMGSVEAKTSSALSSEIETALMQSRYILEPTIQKHHLNIEVTPNYFPVIGAVLARNQRETLAKPWFGLSGYAWGGEKIDVQEFDMPPDKEGKKFTLISTGNKNYDLYDPTGALILHGHAWELEQSMEKDCYGVIRILVNTLETNPGTKFTIVRQPIPLVLNKFASNFSIADISDKGGKATGILNLSLLGNDRSKLPELLNSIISFEVQRNTEKKSAEIRQTLLFLQNQLPIVKRDLNQAESALSQYRAKTGSLGLSFEAQALLSELTSLEQNLEAIKLKKSELLLSFTSRHPLVIALSDKEEQINQALDQLHNRMGMLPKTEQVAITLERDVNVKNQMYLMLLTKIQQLQVVQAGTVSDVRVLSQANVVTISPSKKWLMLLGSVFIGFILAVGIILVRKLFARHFEDPDYIEDQLGVPIYAIIPNSRAQEKLTREMKRKVPGSGPFVLTERFPKDLAIEGLRSLRTTLQFALAEAKGNILCITGSSPGIGKSFLSVNLAYVLADSGRRVLLVDADMRKGKMNVYFAGKNEPGLAEILEGRAVFEQAKQIINNRIDFIPTGHYPKNPSELLITDNLKLFLDQVSSQYDIVLIDTPPILAVTDAVLLTRLASINLLAIGSGIEALNEIEHTVKRLQKNHVEVSGLILNNVHQQKKSYGYYNYNYYYYDYYSEKK